MTGSDQSSGKRHGDLGLLDPEVVRVEQRRALETLGARARLAFAASVAHRLLRQHEELPKEMQRPFSLEWRAVIDAVWADLAGEANGYYVVTHALGRFYLSPYNHNEGQEGPGDADEHEAAAAIYTAECLVHGCVDAAAFAGWRGVDAAFERAEASLSSDEGSRVGGVDEVFAHSLVQEELSRQSEDLALLLRDGTVLDRCDTDGCGAVVEQLRRR